MSNLTVSEDFKNDVKTWIEIDDKERELKAQIKLLTAKKKELTDGILKEMESNEIDNLQISTGGKLKYSVSQVTTPLKKEHIIGVINEEVKDEEIAKDLITKIYNKEQREKVTKVSLKRTNK
tara:strand:- start:352 stop:717 length:366 start_codon:yes stop_codon:yes gene_type:complete